MEKYHFNFTMVTICDFRLYSVTPDRNLMWLKRSASCQHLSSIRTVRFLLLIETPHAANNTLQLSGVGQGRDNTDPSQWQWQVPSTLAITRHKKRCGLNTHAHKLPYISWSMYLSGLILIAHLISIGLCFGVFNYSKTEYSITWKASNHNCSTRVLIFRWKRSDWNSPALLSRAITNAF